MKFNFTAIISLVLANGIAIASSLTPVDVATSFDHGFHSYQELSRRQDPSTDPSFASYQSAANATDHLATFIPDPSDTNHTEHDWEAIIQSVSFAIQNTTSQVQSGGPYDDQAVIDTLQTQYTRVNDS